MEGGYGASDYDTIYAGGGDDYVLTGNAAIYGLDGADLLQTSPAYYSYVEGTGKADHIYGDPYNNCGTVEAYGNGNDDSVVGGCGNDYLDGGVGTDTVDGSSGTDTCTTGETYYNCP